MTIPHPQIQDLDGFGSTCEPLVRVVDTYYARIEYLEELASSGWDGNTVGAVYCKITEGSHPERKRKRQSHQERDRELAEKIFAGAMKAARICSLSGKPLGLYHYATPGRDRLHYYDDVGDEAAWCLSQLTRLRTACRSEGISPPVLRLWLDLEDQHTPLTSAALEEWVTEWCDLFECEEGHAPAIYTSERYVRHHLHKAHALGKFKLVDARYHNNDPDRELEAPELPAGWDHRAAWQYSSKYQGGLDVSAARLGAFEV